MKNILLTAWAGVFLLTGCYAMEVPDVPPTTTSAVATMAETTATTAPTAMTAVTTTMVPTAAVVTTTAATTEAKPKQSPRFPDMEAEVLQLMNEERVAVGAKPLTMEYDYYECAELRARECLVKWSHTRPDERPSYTVYGDFGLQDTIRVASENLAKNFQTPESGVKALMASESHRRNILYEAYEGVAISIVEIDGENGLYAMSQLFIAKKKEECV